MSLLEQRNRNEYLAGHLPTRLKGLDAALCGGIPFGVVTELVGPAGIGKTQVALESKFKCMCKDFLGKIVFLVLHVTHISISVLFTFKN